MVAVRRSTVIDAPISAVWEVLRDFNGHDRWHPAVRRSALEEGRKTDQISAVRSFELETGDRIRERLLSLSDKDKRLRYSIVDADVPLRDYVAEISLKPITDGNRTFWSWTSKFRTPKGREDELAKLVAEGVYEAGFEAVRERVEPLAAQPAVQPNAPVVKSGPDLPGKAMMIDRHGGPEELHLRDIAAPSPGPGQVRLRQTAIGVNFIDVYCRTGYFDLLKPPGSPGMEAVGLVEDVGSNVRHLKPGQRVGYACPPVGAYASARTMDARLVFPLPDFLDDRHAAAILLKGISAEFLLHRVHEVREGETVLVYAPAGGVGQLLCRWANRLGATVIGATSSEEKARIARTAGAHHVILPGRDSLEKQVRDLTQGRGADVVYDAVGRDTFDHSVAALANCGHLVSFGQASGDIGPKNIGALAARSVTLSRPNFGHYTDTPEKVAAITNRLFDAIRNGILRIDIGRTLPLSAAAEAHRALENRETAGATILIPDDLYTKGQDA